MRMQQSLADIEEAFAEEIEEDRERRERLARRAEQRSRQRHLEKAHKHGTMRYAPARAHAHHHGDPGDVGDVLDALPGHELSARDAAAALSGSR